MSDNNHIVLKYHNDGKEKYQSHIVYLFCDIIDDIAFDFNSLGCGCGENYEEAKEDLENKLIKQISILHNMLEKMKSNQLNTVKVDCFGKPI